jgi:hypothetical protein
MRGNRPRTNPVQRHEVPSQRARDGANMDQPRRRAMPEVRKAQIEKVHNKHEFGDPKVAARPEMDEAEEQQIRRDVVGADVGGGRHVDAVGGVEGPCVDELEDEQDDPVEGGDDAVLGEGRGGVVAPDGVVPVLVVAFVWGAEGVVDGGDDEDDVGDEGGDAEEDELLCGVVFAAGEGVDCIARSACCSQPRPSANASTGEGENAYGHSMKPRFQASC